MERNPFAINFGMVPKQYISRDILIDEITEELMSFIIQKEQMPVSELLELTKQKKNEFSQYRVRLKEKGLINTDTHGLVGFKLPRFDVFVKNEMIKI
ncbi:hypothetical protein [Oribacterium sp. FC2011]|uniref:hypothetical protein n=1 Tax=Oribacterium sp. FC2011 TaxID=1408311 RepID=UPI0004E0DE85|nr:hypothetical protein [Oribacterium sp. FC2011]